MAADAALAVYRFAIEDLYRQQEHVLDEQGERLLSLAEPVQRRAARRVLGAVDRRHEVPDRHAADGQRATLTYGQYRAIAGDEPPPGGSRAAFRAFHETYAANANTYAALYNGVLQRDWFQAQARGYTTTLEAALHGNNIPTSVVENLVETTRRGRRAAAPLPPPPEAGARPRPLPRVRRLDPAGGVRPHVRLPRTCSSGSSDVGRAARPRLPAADAARPSAGGGSTSTRTRASAAAPTRRRSTACTRTCCSTTTTRSTPCSRWRTRWATRCTRCWPHAHQPFVYAGYTIFVAEVPSTLSEALFLDQHARAGDRPAGARRAAAARHRRHRRHLLHAGDVRRLRAAGPPPGRAGTSRSRPTRSGDSTVDLLEAYYGDAVDYDDLSRVTWARIPHFFARRTTSISTPPATPRRRSSSRGSRRARRTDRRAAVERYLTMLQAGGSDYPMTLLERAGVDLRRPEPVQAVVDQLDRRVSQLEEEIDRLGAPQA